METSEATTEYLISSEDDVTSDQTPKEVPKHLEQLFLTMYYRKIQRDLNGPQKKKTKYHFIALACLLILVYGLSYYSRSESGAEEDQTVVISLTIDQIVLIGIWVFVSVVVSAICGNTKFMALIFWLVIWWPLLAILASALIYQSGDVLVGSPWILYLLIIAEVVTALTFIFIYQIFPRFITSQWFLKNVGARRFWNIELLDDNTMEYDGIWSRCNRRYQCRYVGDINDEGLPNGQGIWSDDSYNGEVLTGTWANGVPVAPFSSRQYGGRGNTFSAVRLAFFMATDDSFGANKMIPSNNEPPKCGVASVECSIAGDFMSHLPCASLISGPDIEDPDSLTISDCCKIAAYGYDSIEKPVTSIHISSDDPRGVQIDGFRYNPTGMPFSKRIKQILIDVTKAGHEHSSSTNDEQDDEETTLSTHQFSVPDSMLRLEVKNWTRVGTKDALIFIPGFNSWLQHSAESFGQMLAMTKLSEKVYPILYAWPGGQVPTYRCASLISASANNRKYFLQLIQRLQSDGIRNIHIITHSLGVQTLMNAFEDDSDGTPSAISKCFGPAPQYGDTTPSLLDLGKLVCRSITMLNPDFPQYAFQEKGFDTLRRVASLITIVGDKHDQALFWSSVLNGVTNFFGYEQPSVLDSKMKQMESGFHLQRPLGKHVDSLHLNTDATVSFGEKKGCDSFNTRNGGNFEESGKVWLDCDVIDTTGLDTNVNNLRHAAFSINRILLSDIEELIVTGKRASERTTLLHVKGNVYQYCHAPSFVSPE